MKTIQAGQVGLIKTSKILLTVTLSLSFLFLASCDRNKTNKDRQADIAKQAAESINFTENAEIDNIKNRLQLTSQPELSGFVALLDGTGKIVWYGAVKGKITSSGKRLSKPYYYTSGAYPSRITASDEGTWGSSSSYIYFWTVTGQYMQWNSHYLYSNQPFRLNEEPLIVSITNEVK